MKRAVSLLLTALVPLCGLCGCNLMQTAEAAQEEEGLAEGEYEVYGKIRSANGNEIVLVIGTLSGPAFGGRNHLVGEAGEAIPPGAEEGFPDGEGEEAVPDRGGNPGNMEGEGHGKRDGGGPTDMDGGSGDPPNMNDGGAGGSISLDYTGEEITCLIPVTARITTGQGESARSVRFTQLAEKNIVRLVLDENDAIVSVQVLA